MMISRATFNNNFPIRTGIASNLASQIQATTPKAPQLTPQNTLVSASISFLTGLLTAFLTPSPIVAGHQNLAEPSDQAPNLGLLKPRVRSTTPSLPTALKCDIRRSRLENYTSGITAQGFFDDSSVGTNAVKSTKAQKQIHSLTADLT